jgi:preprotein translocase subunit YajC
MSATFAVLFAQAVNATNAAAANASTTDAAAAGQRPMWSSVLLFVIMFVALYFLFIRPTTLAQKKQAQTVKGAKTGDRIVTTGGIHGVISNVKETTFIVKVADNVKLEIEKTNVEKVTRPASGSDADKEVVVKA